MHHQRQRRPRVSRLLLAAVTLIGAGCTCGDAGRDGPGAEGRAEPREVWLEACLRSPQQTLEAIREAARPALTDRQLPPRVDQVVSHLLGIPEDQLQESIDWRRSVQVVLFAVEGGGSLQEGLALRLGRKASDSPLRPASGGRQIATSQGTVHLEADGESLWASPSAWALAAARAQLHTEGCEGDESERDLSLNLSAALLRSRPIKGWVERTGAWLETSARQGTARHGRSALGDPEVAARLLARWGERQRTQGEAAAPLRLTVTASATSGLTLELRGEGSAPEEPPAEEDHRPGNLHLIAPDAYLALATRATAAERRESAGDVVETIASVAGDRMNEAEREELRDRLTKLASATEGWVTVALRPALEPGPLVALAAVEAPEPSRAAEALSKVASLLGEGYLQSALDLLGASLEIASERPGAITFHRMTQLGEPAGPGAPPAGLGQLVGPSPELAWAEREGLLLIAFGPEPQRELTRLGEAAGGDLTASVLTQPALEWITTRHPRATFYGFGWAPELIGAMTRGGPGAEEGLPEGGFALATGEPGAGQGRQALSLSMDRPQLRALLAWLLTPGRREAR